jgi:hypothetical protein
MAHTDHSAARTENLAESGVSGSRGYSSIASEIDFRDDPNDHGAEDLA